MESRPVMEIAIRAIKSGHEAQFKQAREAFISLLKQQPGVVKDWEFSSFFTMPASDTSNIFVGMTRYASPEIMQSIGNSLMQAKEAGEFFGTFDMQAFVAVQPADNKEFILEHHLTKGNVLEVAIRKVKPGQESQFNQKRTGFFDQIALQKGYLFDQEFTDMMSGDKVVLIGWNSIEEFQQAAGSLQSHPSMGEFFSILDVQAYQALTLVH